MTKKYKSIIANAVRNNKPELLINDKRFPVDKFMEHDYESYYYDGKVGCIKQDILCPIGINLAFSCIDLSCSVCPFNYNGENTAMNLKIWLQLGMKDKFESVYDPQYNF